MKQYQVPQFITIEDKVIGPFTLKQFGFLGAGAVLLFILHSLLATLLYYFSALCIGGLALSLAFLKINEQPLPVVIRHGILFLIRPKLYVWKKEQGTPTAPTDDSAKKETTIATLPKMSASKLSDLAWSLDIEKRIRERIKGE